MFPRQRTEIAATFAICDCDGFAICDCDGQRGPLRVQWKTAIDLQF